MSLLKSRFSMSATALALGVTLGFAGLSGCERKEKVIDVETPGVDVEVERNLDTGEVEVETNRN